MGLWERNPKHGYFYFQWTFTSKIPVRSVTSLWQWLLVSWVLRTSPKFTTGVKYHFHQDFYQIRDHMSSIKLIRKMQNINRPTLYCLIFKVKLSPLETTKALGGCESKDSYCIFLATALRRGRVARPKLGHLYPRESTGSHFTGGWTSLDTKEWRKISIPPPPGIEPEPFSS